MSDEDECTVPDSKINALMSASVQLASDVAAFLSVNKKVLPEEIVSRLVERHNEVLRTLDEINPAPVPLREMLL